VKIKMMIALYQTFEKITQNLNYADTMALCTTNQELGQYYLDPNFWRRKALHVYNYDIQKLGGSTTSALVYRDLEGFTQSKVSIPVLLADKDHVEFWALMLHHWSDVVETREDATMILEECIMANQQQETSYGSAFRSILFLAEYQSGVCFMKLDIIALTRPFWFSNYLAKYGSTQHHGRKLPQTLTHTLVTELVSGKMSLEEMLFDLFSQERYEEVIVMLEQFGCCHQHNDVEDIVEALLDVGLDPRVHEDLLERLFQYSKTHYHGRFNVIDYILNNSHVISTSLARKLVGLIWYSTIPVLIEQLELRDLVHTNVYRYITPSSDASLRYDYQRHRILKNLHTLAKFIINNSTRMSQATIDWILRPYATTTNTHGRTMEVVVSYLMIEFEANKMTHTSACRYISSFYG
jgi:hypothetical protein